jgi:outer membrane receptor protein involved in Fe transport
MKKLILLFIFTISVNSYAQLDKSKIPKPGILSGKVIDQKTKETLPYVNIVIRDTAKKIITGGITTLDGIFNIKDIPEGKSLVDVQFIGYKTFSTEVTVKNDNYKINLGTIQLSEDATTLDEVEIRAEVSTVVQKIDRKVINVGKDLTAAGATASELLNNVQSVSLDSQTGALSLRGNSNVRVLVDGKPTSISTAQLLQQIPSSSIKSIELITNPSAKYNPEGMSGIINIILNKKATIGFNGSVNTGITRGENTRYNGSLDMNYKTGQVNFYSNYGYNKGDQHNYGNVTRTGTNASLQEFDFINKNESHLLKLGADFYISDKKTLSVYTTQSFADALGTGSTKVSMGGVPVINAPFDTNSSGIRSGVYNVNYKVDFEKEGHNLELEATFSNSKSPEVATYKQLLNPSNYSNVVKNNGDNTLLNIDYTNPVSKKTKIELGAEVRINKTTNMNTTTQTGFNNSSFTYDRKIYSAYFNYGYEIDKVTMQLGARAELYTVDGSFNEETKQSAAYKNDILSLYPSAFITYNPSEKNQFQFSYSRRVDRPSIQQVNPIREWSTPLVTSLGNPNLLPQFTNSFEVNYTRQIEGGSFTFGTFFRRVNDEISTILYKDPNDLTNTKQIKSDGNFDGNNRYGVEMSSNYKVANWWRVNASLDFYSQTLKGIVAGAQSEVTNSTFNVRLSNSFTATKKLRFQLFAMYRGANEDLQFKTDPMWMINTGGNYSVLDGKGNITFRVNDIFQSMKFKFNSTVPFTQHGQFQGESQSAYIGFSYRFGGGKNRAKSRRDRDDNEKEGGGFI